MNIEFVPKEIKKNHNVSHESVVKRSLQIIAAFVVLIVTIFILVSTSVNLIAAYAPISFGKSLGDGLTHIFDSNEEKADAKQIELVNSIFKKLLENIEEDVSDLSLIVANDEEFENAVAVPGGKIIITTGLLKHLKTENQIAMILAHEIGHQINRDPLKALGTGLITAFIGYLFSFDSDATMAQSINGLMSLKFSRSHEEKADLFALNLLNKTYGHVGGSIKAFEALLKIISKYHDEDSMLNIEILQTHPKTEKRIKRLELIISDRNLIKGKEIPVSYTAP